MYFWKINKLKEDIKNKQLSEKDRFLYTFIYIVLSALAIEMASYLFVESKTMWDYLYSVSAVLITAISTILAFKANGGPAGTDFLGRYFSICFLVMIRLTVFFLPMFIMIISYDIYFFPEDEEIPTHAVHVVPFLIWYAAFYWRVIYHIGDIRNEK